ncbi:MFS transporter, partial [Actinotignum urinale]|nr:MFS transporter [Actinotignum urinale]
MKKRSAGLVIAIAVIVLELIGGMQTYLNQLILPILAKDLHAQHLYGVIMGVSAMSSMAGLPIGAALMNRIRLP